MINQVSKKSDILSSGRLLKQYYRCPKTNNYRGVVVAHSNPGTREVYFGFSLCNTKLDRFSKSHGTMIAVNRSLKQSVAMVPYTIEYLYKRFVDRVMRYFGGHLGEYVFYRQALSSECVVLNNSFSKDVLAPQDRKYIHSTTMIQITKPFFDKEYFLGQVYEN
jgi:hypothetical protein